MIFHSAACMLKIMKMQTNLFCTLFTTMIHNEMPGPCFTKVSLDRSFVLLDPETQTKIAITRATAHHSAR